MLGERGRERLRDPRREAESILLWVESSVEYTAKGRPSTEDPFILPSCSHLHKPAKTAEGLRIPAANFHPRRCNQLN